MCSICKKQSCRPDPEHVAALEAELAEWRKARRALAAGVQSYTIGSRSLTRMSLGDIREAIRDIQQELAELCQCQGRGIRVLTGTPRH